MKTVNKTPIMRVFMWSISSSAADLWFTISNIILIVGAAAVLIGTIGAVFMAGVRDQFSNERISANESATALARAASDKANKDASDANERAAKLEKEAAEARLETERLKSQISWRVIPQDAALKLRTSLAEHPGAVNLRYTDGDPEALFLAIQISKILGNAKWQVAPGATKPANVIFFGISLPDSGTADAEALRNAFQAAGLSFSTTPVPQSGVSFSVTTIPSAPTLMIGSKAPALP